MGGTGEGSGSGTDRGSLGAGRRLVLWFHLEGNRLAVAGVVEVVVFLLTAALVGAGLVDVGPGSSFVTTLGSGLTAGVITLVTVTLSINQLLLSRVFGSLDELTTRIEGARSFRDRVADLAGVHATPNDPTEFLDLVLGSIRDRATGLGTDPNAEYPGALSDALAAHRESVVGYVDEVARANRDASGSGTIDVLTALLGPDYADHLTDTHRLARAHDRALVAADRRRLAELADLLECIAIVRQHLKTLSIQQDLAQLSRLVAYTGTIALLVAVYLSVVYRTNGTTTLSPRVLPLAASVGLAVIVSPLAVLVSYVLRVATISRYTVSAGPTVPPEERFTPREEDA